MKNALASNGSFYKLGGPSSGSRPYNLGSRVRPLIFGNSHGILLYGGFTTHGFINY